MNRIIITVLSIIIPSIILGTPTVNTYTNPTLGLTVTKPSHWTYVSLTDYYNQLSYAKLSEPDLATTYQSKSALPILIIAQNREPIGAINPNIKFNIYPLENKTNHLPEVLLSIILDSYKPILSNVRIKQAPKALRISNYPAAHAKIQFEYPLRSGHTHTVMSQLWVIKRKHTFWLISAGTHVKDKQNQATISRIISEIQVTQ